MTAITNDGFRYEFVDQIANQTISGTASDNVFAIYKGTMPTNTTNWVQADSSSDLLVEFTNFTMVNSGNRVVLENFPNPAIVNALATGTAVWYAYVHTASVLRYWFGDVSTNAGTGSLHLDSVSLTVGQPVTIENVSIAITAA